MITPGIVVAHHYAGECIVLELASSPAVTWIALQQDTRLQNLPVDARWWTLLPLGGGAVLAAEALLTVVREASYQDFLRAVEHTSVDGRRRLAAVFPAYAAEALALAKEQ